MQLHRRMTEAAREWELLERDNGVLYRGAQLAQAREWAGLHPNALNAGENAFLEASNAFEQNKIAEREAQQKRELEAAQKLAETERRSATRLRIRNCVITTVGSIAIILALLAGMFGLQSNRNAVQAETNFKQAEAQRLALEANCLLTTGGSSEQIALLSLQSMKTQYTLEGDAALAAAARLDYPVKTFNQAGPVWSATFSPDGMYILVGDDNKTVKLWDVQSGQELRRFPGHAAMFTKDGKHILTQSFGEDIRMWDAATGQEVYQITVDTRGRPMIAYSNDGKTLWTSSGDRTIRRWDAASGKELGVFLEKPEMIGSMSISPDDRYLLISNNSTVQLWDLQADLKLRDFSFDTTTSGIFSPDGKSMLTVDAYGKAFLWDLGTGQEVSSFIGHNQPIYDMAFSPDNKYLLTSAADKTVRIWDVQTGQELRRFAFAVFVTGLAFSPDGRWVLTGADDGIVRLWALHAGSSLLTLNYGGIVSAVAFSPDGKLILIGGDGGIARLWDAATGEKLREFVGHTDAINYGAAFSPDGKYIVTGGWDATVRLWDARTSKEVYQFVADLRDVNDVRFSPDGKYLLTAGGDGVRLWDAQTGDKIRQFGEIRNVYRATFSPNGKYVLSSASGTDDGKVRLWNTLTGQLIREYQNGLGPTGSVDFSPDMKYIIADGGYENDVRIWDFQTGKELHRLIGHNGPIYTAVFSPDGKYIVTAGSDSTARLWNVQTGDELRRFIGHTSGVENVAFSPDGKYILTGSDDGTAMLWDVDYHTTMDYLCSVLLRDFTEDERAQFGITDNTPTCPNP